MLRLAATDLATFLDRNSTQPSLNTRWYFPVFLSVLSGCRNIRPTLWKEWNQHQEDLTRSVLLSELREEGGGLRDIVPGGDAGQVDDAGFLLALLGVEKLMSAQLSTPPGRLQPAVRRGHRVS